MKNLIKLVFLPVLLLFSTPLFAQGNYDFYLETAEKRLREGDCARAQASYDIYKEMAGKTNADLQRRINECKNPPVNPQSNTTRHSAEPEMVFVQGGTFIMGCTSEQGNDCYGDEKPNHQVRLSDFYIGKYEVTQKQWREIMGSDIRQQRDKEGTTNSIYGEGDNYPVYYISWNEVQEFISRLNARTGKNYRLPTEAEWEYAARGGNKSRGYKYSGSNMPLDVAWYKDNSVSTAHPVDTKQPNELGIYNMSGNVREWCYDWYGAYSSASQTDPAGPSSGTYRVNCGGSWGVSAQFVRVSSRNYNTPDTRYSSIGFRLACSSK